IVQMSPPRLTLQVQATEIWSPSASLVTVDAVKVSLVWGDPGLKVGVVRLGGVLTTVLADAVLFAGVTSFGDETVALLLIDVVPVPPGAVTVIVMLGASAAFARLPPVRLHVTVPEALLQVQFVPAALTKVTPAGSVSTTLTADASSGPPLWTPIA